MSFKERKEKARTFLGCCNDVFCCVQGIIALICDIFRPLIDAKLEAEKAQMDIIEKEQSATDAELVGALAMLKSMEEKFARSDEKAEKKREAYNKEVDNVRKVLNKDT